MPKVSVESSDDLMVCRYSGHFDYDGLVTVSGVLLPHAKRHMIWDLTDSDDVAMSLEQVRNFTEFTRDLSCDRPSGSKTAIVAFSYPNLELFNMYAAFCEITGVPFDIRVFCFPSDAEKWLGYNA